MTCLEPLEAFSGGAIQNGVLAPAERFCAGDHQLFRKNVLAALCLNQCIGKFRVQAHGHIVRQGPGRCCPDDHMRARRISGCKNLFQVFIGQGKTHVDRRRGVVVILHFRLGQRRVAGAAPVNGLLGARHAPGGHKLCKFTGSDGFICRIHAHIGVIPVAQHTQTLEFLALYIKPFIGILAAELAHHMGGQVFLLFLEVLLNLVLDGQSVAVPAGNIA